MGHIAAALLKTGITSGFKDFKYCPYATIMSVFGLIPLLFSILMFSVSLGDQRVYVQNVLLDRLISVAVCVACMGISILTNKLAGAASKRYINKMVRKSWEYADRYSIDNPQMLERCKELNPEFAQKLAERQERERLQDMLLEQTMQEVLREREARRLANTADGSN